ncbi:hypothetical protein [Duncaniella dubosii]|uniref:hypothetical protein n=1 Tax=Duncaniella dubosii TaxID=2518971 RepID=UPI0032B2F3DD
MIDKCSDILHSVKGELFAKLKKEHAFWSYDIDDVTIDKLDDDQLIALTMRYLDLDEIKLLFRVFPFRKIKNAWKNILVPEGDYLYALNRFFAWYYFNAKRPDAYLKSLQTRRFNAMFG